MPSSSGRGADLLPPHLLATLGGLELTARRIVDGVLPGMHRSRRRGASAEFAGLRPYRPGDDLRSVDWRMVGRSDRWFVKEFREDTRLSSMILLDASASMAWSSRPDTLPEKFWYGRILAASLALLLLRQGDRVGLVPFSDEVGSWLPPRGGPTQEVLMLRSLGGIEPSGGTDAASALRDVALRLRRAGIVILVSDLLMEPEPAERALRFLAHRGHHVVVAHLMDPGERELDGTGRARLRDPETGISLRVSIPDARAAYREEVDAAIRGWRRALRPAGIEHHLVDTSQPMARALRTMLRTRGRS